MNIQNLRGRADRSRVDHSVLGLCYCICIADPVSKKEMSEILMEVQHRMRSKGVDVPQFFESDLEVFRCPFQSMVNHRI